MLRDLLFRLRSLFRRTTVERELDDELRFHRERELARYRERGLSPAEAERRFGIDFGDVARVKDDCRDARGVSLIEHLSRDARYALRSLRKSPSFTIVAVATLALGLGATTAIVSVVYDALLRPLPYANPSSLVVLHETTPAVGLVSVSYPNFLDWRAQSHSFAGMAAVNDVAVDLGGVDQPESLEGDAVTSNYLSLLGVKPAIGRDFTADEDRIGTTRVALLSDTLWHTHFGGDQGVVGRTVLLDGQTTTIIGVLPATFTSIDPVALLMPMGMWLSPGVGRGDRGDQVVVGRLSRGVTLERAQAEMSGIAAALARAYPQTNNGFGADLETYRDVMVGSTRQALLVLLGAVACVLLIACANVANLCLIRGAGRSREIALRLAIGAGRGRIIAQHLVESAVLVAIGGATGLAVAVAGRSLLTSLITTTVPGSTTTGVDAGVLGCAALTITIATLLVGAAPAIQATRANLHMELKDGGRAGTGSRWQQRWRAILATAEVALAIVLLVGAGLMLRSLSQLFAVDPGISTHHVLTMQFGLRTARYATPEAKQLFWQELLEKTAALPGVEVAALGTGVPLTNDHSRRDITIEGMPADVSSYPHPDVHIVTPGYTAALGVHLLQGRTFTDADTDHAPLVGLINRSIADKFFPNRSPIGQRFVSGHAKPGDSPKWVTIVGVVADTRMYGLDQPSRLEIYLPLRQAPRGGSMLLLKTATSPAVLMPAIRAIVSSLDRNQPIAAAETLDDLRDQSVSTRHSTLVLLSLFSALALVLAAIGIYGVMAYAVAQRTKELGIRRALGAASGDMLRTVAAQGVRIAGAGIAIGVVLAMIASQLMRSMLFAVDAIDPLTLIFVSAGVAVVTALACVIPGVRALRIDPMIALRQE